MPVHAVLGISSMQSGLFAFGMVSNSRICIIWHHEDVQATATHSATDSLCLHSFPCTPLQQLLLQLAVLHVTEQPQRCIARSTQLDRRWPEAYCCFTSSRQLAVALLNQLLQLRLQLPCQLKANMHFHLQQCAATTGRSAVHVGAAGAASTLCCTDSYEHQPHANS